MEVFRDDSAAVPIITCKTFQPVPADIVSRFLRESIGDLLHGVLDQEQTDWLLTNIIHDLA